MDINRSLVSDEVVAALGVKFASGMEGRMSEASRCKVEFCRS